MKLRDFTPEAVTLLAILLALAAVGAVLMFLLAFIAVSMA